MPFTFLPHQAPVLPLLGRGRRTARRIDGVALVVGSMAPDLFYVASGTPFAFDSHALVPLLWTSVPLTVAVCVVFRRWVARPLAAHLPDAGVLHLRDFGTVARRRPALSVTVVGALVGAVSHIALDSFTHSSGWATQHWSVLRTVVFVHNDIGYRLASVLQYVCSILGASFTLAWLWWAGRRRLLLADGTANDLPATTSASRTRIWGVTAGAAPVALLVLLTTRGYGSPVAAFIRASVVLLAGLGLGAWWAGRSLTRGQERELVSSMRTTSSSDTAVKSLYQ